MSKNLKKINIDLSAANYTPAQLKKIHAALQKTLHKKAATFSKAQVKGLVNTAIVVVNFEKIEIGLSELTATCNGQSQTINHSGSIIFTNVNKDDIINIDCITIGDTTVVVTGVTTMPASMNYSGNFNDNFIVQ